MIANPTAVDRKLRSAVDLVARDPDLNLTALFGPEHGLRGDAQDMIAVGEATDARTGLPVYSLYGDDEASLAPAQAQLENLDAVVFDIQDVGSRYYTYVWTLVYAMRACAQAGVAVVVLDRPNPIGGVAVEGGGIEDDCRSFVGLCPVPNRHGMTVGEIARWANAAEGIGADLHVVAMEGWSRGMYYEDTGLPWIMPSPNMPTRDTALVYPGMCLVEGTELSEGRGTTRPFELFGAPFIDGHVLASELSGAVPGAAFRPVTFLPTFQKHAGVPCGGVQIHVTDRDAFAPYLTGVAALRAIKLLWPDEFQWRTRAYEFRADVPAIDLLTGTPSVREAIDAGAALDDIAASWRDDEATFRDARQEWLLYE